MARRVRDAILDTPAARAKLKARGKPYFRGIDQGLALAYRRNRNGTGSWSVRRMIGYDRYELVKLGTADDRQPADGETILNFGQAQKAALRHAALAVVPVAGPVLTVANAIADYIAAREARLELGKPGVRRDARSRLRRHVGEELQTRPLAQLTTGDLSRWREGLAAKLSEGAVRRTVNDFKAALNRAVEQHELPASVRDTIRRGLKTETATSAVAREAQVLPDGDIRRLVAAAGEIDAEGEWEGGLGCLMLVLAASGSRFSQIVRLRVSDVQVPRKRILVPVSKKGRGSKQATHIPVPVGDDVVTALKPIVAGRKGQEVLFLRPRWEPAGEGKWRKREDREPWHSSSELTRLWRIIVARAGLSADTVPYALRHSSIVRGLRAGLPVRLVAALHDTSSAMVERHYAAHITDALAELAAKAVVQLVQSASAPLRRVGE